MPHVFVCAKNLAVFLATGSAGAEEGSFVSPQEKKRHLLSQCSLDGKIREGCCCSMEGIISRKKCKWMGE